MNILLRASPKILPRIPSPTPHPQNPLPSRVCPCLSLPPLLPPQACISSTLMVPGRLATIGAMNRDSSSHATPAPRNIVSKAPFPLTSQCADSSLAWALSCCFFYPKPFLVSLSPALINVLSESPGLMLQYLSYTKSGTQMLQAGLGPVPVPVTKPQRDIT